jgi:hypothetical protein
MDKKTTGMVGLVAAIVLCGLPGLCLLCIGPLFAFIGLIPDANIDVFGSSDPGAAVGLGIGMLCASIIFVAVPVLVWYFAVRDVPAKEEIIDYEGDIPEDM